MRTHSAKFDFFAIFLGIASKFKIILYQKNAEKIGKNPFHNTLLLTYIIHFFIILDHMWHLWRIRAPGGYKSLWALESHRKRNLFGLKEFFFGNFDFKNGCKNEFEDNNEKLCSRLKNRVPLQIDFRANWTHEFIPTAWE